MRRMLIGLVLLLQAVSCMAVVYESEDSVRVEALLRSANRLSRDSSLMLHYARQFLGVPYVAHTLESKDGQERLVVNLRQMDCTTLVETVTALTLASSHGGTGWKDYCRWLKTLRYRHGEMDGYASRNHYFSQWIESAQSLGLVEEVTGGRDSDAFPFTATQHLHLHYMSRHRTAYPAIATNDEEARRVAQHEKAFAGKQVCYIPAALTECSRQELSCVQDGDILALVTKKDGLDVSHLGLAVWGDDGLLHLLNASSISHRVVLDSTPLCRYLEQHPSSVGIRVIRVRR